VMFRLEARTLNSKDDIFWKHDPSNQNVFNYIIGYFFNFSKI
jgi:hypothetical protein